MIEPANHPNRRRNLFRLAAMLLCASASLMSACGTSRTLIHSESTPSAFDGAVRKRWHLGMTRDQVLDAAAEIKLKVSSTEDARALLALDPNYKSGEALSARITPPGIFIDVAYFEVRHQIGWLYFLFGTADDLRLVAYRLSDEQRQTAEQQRALAGQSTPPHDDLRIILPEGATP